MIITLLRTFILYIILTLAIRIMGRRQVGELQAGELVITLLLSQIASQPICDTETPLSYSITAFLVLVSLEIIMSAFALKSVKFRSLWQGNALVLIRDGVLDQKQMKRLRFTMDDLIEALHQKNVFDISDVQYAISETDGTLSVMLKPEKRTVVNEDMKLNPKDTALPCLVILDGRVLDINFVDCDLSSEKLGILLSRAHVKQEEIMLMTADKCGNTYIVRRDEKL